MKTEHSFIAERALANHCAELLGHGAQDEGSRDELRADFAETLGVHLARRLQPLLAGKPIRLSSEAGGAATASSIGQSIGPRAANFAVECGDAATPFLISFDIKTAVALTDSLFGGGFIVGEDEVDTLSPSSVLALRRLALAAAQAIAASAGDGDVAEVTGHHTSVARLELFPRGDYCLSWKVIAQQDGVEDWHMLIAAREADVDAMLAARGAKAAQTRETRSSDPLSEPFADIPIPLRAVLSEFKLPLSRIAGLAPGETIPVALAREVPLKIGQRTLARGRIGALDDRVALRLVNQGNGEFQS